MGVGSPLMRMGTIVPPPIHEKMSDTNLYEMDAESPAAEKTLLPIQSTNNRIWV
jgi:hypothetical protein